MTARTHILPTNPRWNAAWGGVATALLGVGLLAFGVFVNSSYDLCWRFSSREVTNQVVLIEMDAAARGALHQTPEAWDRTIHAQLLDYLREDGCPLVVFDIIFREERQPESDRILAEAMRRHGGVVLAARLVDTSHPRLMGNQVLPPHLRFRDATTNWGVAQVGWEPDLVVRRPWFHPDPGSNPSLPWAAARLNGARLEPPAAAVEEGRWLRYYGVEGAWTRLSYHFATNQQPGFFRDKIVFVGNRPDTPLPDGERDEFRTPFSRRAGPAASGMEILATTFLNLMNRDWLRRLSRWQEALVLMIAGAVLGVWLPMLRWPLAPIQGAGVAVLVALAGICLSHFTNWWFPWLVVAGGQVPVAVAWSVFAARRPVRCEPPAATAIVPPPSPKPEIPNTPGYERIVCFGKGAYGQVWLVRTAIGEWQALKVMFRASFQDAAPYAREFNGISHYVPVSRGHPGLLRIDFISAPQDEGYFYYVMELGDGLAEGWKQNPASYQPRDLASRCRQTEKNRLPLAECVRVGVALAESVDFLHRHQCIHRDIKPSNVVFVGGQPKLADVGLVTEVRRADRDVSYLGTEGYIAPEGPGEPAADIYSLGMLLYVISTGRDPCRNIELSDTLVEQAPEFMFLNRVICRACHGNPGARYTGAELREALLDVQRRLAADGMH